MFTRFNGNVVPFADDATSTNRTVFGGTTQSDLIDDNLNTNFKKGWEIVGLNDNPTREDFNGMGYTLGALTAYLYEMGISEWNASQKYRANSRVTGIDGKIYKSLTGTTGIPNVGKNPTTDAVNWELEFKNFVTLTENQTIAGVKTFSSSPIVPTPTNGNQATNKTYVDEKAGISLATANSYDLGVGQTWQDVTTSRSLGVTYTNTTNKPISVKVRYGSGTLSITVNGVADVDQCVATSGNNVNIGAIVPSGSTYIVTGGGIYQWTELR